MPYFKGEWNIILYLEPLYIIKEYIGQNEFSDGESFKVDVFKIKMYAYSWYVCLVEVRVEEGRSKIITWSKLKRYVDKKTSHDIKFKKRDIDEIYFEADPSKEEVVKH